MAEWPKEIAVCLECGEPGTMDGGFARYCSQGGEHGPTQTVSVVPSSEAEMLAETLDLAAGFLYRDASERTNPTYVRTRIHAALNHYRTLQGGER